MPKDDIARPDKPKDLLDLPILISAQGMVDNEISGWMGGDYKKLNIVSRYNLLFNASLLVEEGVGYAICLDGIIKTTADSPLCFRPLEPKLEVSMVLVWKKDQIFSKVARKFIEGLNNRDRAGQYLEQS